MNRLPPHDETAERAVLGACLVDEDAIQDVSFLRPDDFYSVKYREAYRVMRNLDKNGHPIDFITLESAGVNDEGISMLMGCMAEMPTSVGANSYAKIVAASAQRRKLIDAAGKIANAAFNTDANIDRIVEKAQEVLTASIADHKTAYPSLNGSQQSPISMSNLLAMDFPPLVFIVMGLLALGHLVVLAGRPKSGKSWLVLQLAKHIDIGAAFLGRETRKARVLVIALEDGLRRVYQRANILKWQPAENVDISHSLPKLDGEGGLGPGISYISQMAQQYSVIIIDTLISALSGMANENDNVAMAAIFNEIARIAHDTNTLILIVHHTGKGSSDDIFHTLRGASAIRGGYDVGLLLERRNDEKEAVLHVESRDFEAQNLGLRQVDNGAGWEFVGTAYDIEQIRAGRKTLQAMFDNDPEDEGMTAAQITKTRGVSEQVIYKQLKKLAADGCVYSEENNSGKGRPLSIWHVAEHYRR